MRLPDVDHISRRANKASDTPSKPSEQNLLVERHYNTGLVYRLLYAFIDAKTSHGVRKLDTHHSNMHRS